MIAEESEIAKSPSLNAGIFLNGLAARKSGSSEPRPICFSSTSIPFSAAKARTLRTKGDNDEPYTIMPKLPDGFYYATIHILRRAAVQAKLFALLRPPL